MAKHCEYEIEKVCAFCEYAEELNDADKMLCSRKGVVSSGFTCKKIRYDPLKRTPKPPLIIPGLSEEDLL